MKFNSPNGEQTYIPAHTLEPYLPVHWHCPVRTFLYDISTVAALYSVGMYVRVREEKNGELHPSVAMSGDILSEAHDLALIVCNRVKESTPFICVFCSKFSFFITRREGDAERCVCIDHEHTDFSEILRSRMPRVKPPWIRQGKTGVVEFMARDAPAEQAARALLTRYTAPSVAQQLAKADSSRADHAIQQLLFDPKD